MQTRYTYDWLNWDPSEADDPQLEPETYEVKSMPTEYEDRALYYRRRLRELRRRPTVYTKSLDDFDHHSGDHACSCGGACSSCSTGDFARDGRCKSLSQKLAALDALHDQYVTALRIKTLDRKLQYELVDDQSKSFYSRPTGGEEILVGKIAHYAREKEEVRRELCLNCGICD